MTGPKYSIQQPARIYNIPQGNYSATPLYYNSRFKVNRQYGTYSPISRTDEFQQYKTAA